MNKLRSDTEFVNPMYDNSGYTSAINPMFAGPDTGYAYTSVEAVKNPLYDGGEESPYYAETPYLEVTSNDVVEDGITPTHAEGDVMDIKAMIVPQPE